MAVDTEPLKGRHGVILYSAQSVKGTPVTPATAAGLGGYEITIDTDIRQLWGLGSEQARFNKPGNSQVPFSFNIEAIQDETLIARGLRSSGVLPWTTFGFGYTLDDGTDFAYQVQDCKIHSLDVSLDAGGLLTGSFQGVGGLITEVPMLTAAHLSPTPFMSYEAVLTKGGSAYEAVSFRLSVNNNVTVDFAIPGSAPASFKRGWTYQTEGNLEVSGEITRFAKSGANLQAATLTDFAIVLTMTDAAGGMAPNTSTFTISDAQWGSERVSAAPDGDIRFTTPFVAKSVTIA